MINSVKTEIRFEPEIVAAPFAADN